jgi:amino acid permease
MNSSPGVPLAREVLVGEEDKLRKAIVVGTLIPALLYFIFTFLVLGISGDMTSPDAISGLRSVLGSKIVFIGSVFGFLTSSTIFLNLATALKRSFQEDFHFKMKWALLLVIVPPYLLFLSGIRNFIDIIDLVGGLAVSVEALLLVFMYVKARKCGDRLPEYSFGLPNWVMYATMGVVAFGAAYTLIFK